MLNRSRISLRIKRLGLAFSLIVLLAADAVIAKEAFTRADVEAGFCSRRKAPVCRVLIRFYQRIISPIGASSCRMYPSCSAYAHEAFENHGFFRGMMLTSDRLMRDTSFAGTQYPLIRKDGQWLLYDPLRENTWWWRKGRRRAIVGRAQ